MTCKPILQFLEENGIVPTRENKKRWQQGWTLSELRQGYENVLDDYKNTLEKEFGENFVAIKKQEKQKENEKKISLAIEREKQRRKNFAKNFQQFTK